MNASVDDHDRRFRIDEDGDVDETMASANSTFYLSCDQEEVDQLTPTSLMPGDTIPSNQAAPPRFFFGEDETFSCNPSAYFTSPASSPHSSSASSIASPSSSSPTSTIDSPSSTSLVEELFEEMKHFQEDVVWSSHKELQQHSPGSINVEEELADDLQLEAQVNWH